MGLSLSGVWTRDSHQVRSTRMMDTTLLGPRTRELDRIIVVFLLCVI